MTGASPGLAPRGRRTGRGELEGQGDPTGINVASLVACRMDVPGISRIFA